MHFVRFFSVIEYLVNNAPLVLLPLVIKKKHAIKNLLYTTKQPNTNKQSHKL